MNNLYFAIQKVQPDYFVIHSADSSVFHFNLSKITYFLCGIFVFQLINYKRGLIKEALMMGKRKFMVLVLALMSVIFITKCEQWYEKGNPHFINEEQYQKLVKNPQTREKGTVILKFFTPWCRYCRYLKEIIDNLRAQQQLAMKIYEVNCDGENHDFCVSMGVRSYPKMMVFVDGQFKETMDGFYPHHVVKELLLKYNHPIQNEEEQHEIEKEDTQQKGHKQPSKEHSQKHKKNKKHKKSQKQQHKQEHKEEHKNEQKQEQQQQKEELATAKQPEDTDIHQQPQQIPPHPEAQEQKKKDEHQANFIEPSIVKPQESQKTQTVSTQIIKNKINSKTDQAQKQKTVDDKLEKSATVNNQDINNQGVKPKHQSVKTQKPHQPSSSDKLQGQPQPVIQQQQNVAIMDGYKEATQQQKRIVQDIKKKMEQIQVIDATKLLSDHLQSHNYWKYLLYIVSIVIGGYYFLQIMRAQPATESGQEEEKNTITIEHSDINPKDSVHRPSDVYSNKIHRHPNEQEQRINHIQIRDQDL